MVVQVRAAGINPGEIAIRECRMHETFPATFPFGEGSDLAGVVRELGEGANGFAPGDELLGWSGERSSHAELVSVPVGQLTGSRRRRAASARSPRSSPGCGARG